MAKVVYNTCYGGFGLSTEAVIHYLTLKGLDYRTEEHEWMKIMNPYFFVNDEHFSASDIDRQDPILVQVVEELGEKADGYCAKLAIKDVPSGRLYRIDEYDGQEWVVMSGEDNWQVAE